MGWTPFADGPVASPMEHRASVGAIGAKNLNLRRRMPLSPLNKNKQKEQSSAEGNEVLHVHSNRAIGGKAGMQTKGSGGDWFNVLNQSAPAIPETNSGDWRLPSEVDPSANRSRVRSEVLPLLVSKSIHTCIHACIHNIVFSLLILMSLLVRAPIPVRCTSLLLNKAMICSCRSRRHFQRFTNPSASSPH
jgi:hypothetical protein